MGQPKPKEPWVAVMLTFFLPGLGQMYARQWKKGMLFLLLNIVAFAGIYLYIMSPETKTYKYMLGVIPVALFFTLYIIIDAYLSVARYNRSRQLVLKRSVIRWILVVVGILIFNSINTQSVLTWYLRNNVVEAFKFPSDSMKPAVMKDDRILVDKAAYKKAEPQRGDIILFLYPEEKSRSLIKRLIAKSGETVEIKDGHVYINDQLVELPPIKNVFYYNRGPYGEAGKKITVPEGSYYVLGDNSSSSHDSRFWGFVPKEDVSGKAIKIYYPFDRSGPIR